MARTDKPGAGGRGPQQQQQRPLGTQVPAARPQFATVGGYVMPQQAVGAQQQLTQAQQQAVVAAAAAGGRPPLIAIPGQPGAQQLFINPALGPGANIQAAFYAQQLHAMVLAQQQAGQRPAQAPVQQHAVGQAGAAALAARAPSPVGNAVQQSGARPAVSLVPPANFTISLQLSTGEVRPHHIPQDFFRAHPNEWQAWVTNPNLHGELWAKYTQWHTMVANRAVPPVRPTASAVQSGAKRPRADVAPAVRPPMHAGSVGGLGGAAAMRSASPGLPGGGAQQQPPSAAAAGAAAQAALQQRMAAAAAAGGARGFPSVAKPGDEEGKLFLPKPRLQALVHEVCGPGAKLTSDAEAALKQLAQDFVSNAVAFGVSMAKRRKGETLEQADLQLYLERTWNLQVPGFSEAEVRPYRRPAASDIHRARMAAVRRSAAEAAAAAGGGAGAGAGGKAGAGAAAQEGTGAGAAAAAQATAQEEKQGADGPGSDGKGGQVQQAQQQQAQPQNGAAGSAAGKGSAAATSGAAAAAAPVANGAAGNEKDDLDMPDFGD